MSKVKARGPGAIRTGASGGCAQSIEPPQGERDELDELDEPCPRK